MGNGVYFVNLPNPKSRNKEGNETGIYTFTRVYNWYRLRNTIDNKTGSYCLELQIVYA